MMKNDQPIDRLCTLCYVTLSAIGYRQWRRQDLLRGGAKQEMRSRGTRGKLQGRVQQLLDD